MEFEGLFRTNRVTEEMLKKQNSWEPSILLSPPIISSHINPDLKIEEIKSPEVTAILEEEKENHVPIQSPKKSPDFNATITCGIGRATSTPKSIYKAD